MSVEGILREAKEAVAKHVPSNVEVTGIYLEGPVIVIYTKNLDEFADNTNIVRKLAQTLRRRIAIRPDPSILEDPEKVKAEIEEIIPEDADVEDIFFNEDTGEVTIEAGSPGIVIGKHGAVLNQIKKETGWAPKVARAPPIQSKTIHDIRSLMRASHDERKEFLRKVGRRLARETIEGEKWVRVTALGGFREVGRSASLLSTQESKVLVDCGLAMGGGEDNMIPYLKAPEVMPLDTIDAVVITHAHLDHSGLVPALFKYGYDGPIYATAPTRDMMSLLQVDSIKVAYGEGNKSLYESSHIREGVKHTITLDYGETTDIAPDVRLTFQNAGHIIGSSVAHFHVGDGLYNVAFTGDIKYERTWLFNPTQHKFPRLEALVMESTYGGYHDLQPSRKEATDQIQTLLKKVLDRNGKVLVPVFAVGRSQEVMLAIEDLMRKGKIPTVPVYLDGMIWEATAIHTAYPEFLNSKLRNKIFQKKENPFLSEIFNRVDSRDMREDIIHQPDSCIVLATSGMMNGGPVMEYFKNWASEKNNCLIFVGYQAEGTFGRRLQRGMSKATVQDRGNSISIDVNFDVQVCDGFSGHSDRLQLIRYVSRLSPRPKKIIIGHGEEKKCIDLASTLYKKYGMETKAPMNLETIRLQ